jgi:uncharacterized protein (TIGR03435 family)
MHLTRTTFCLACLLGLVPVSGITISAQAPAASPSVHPAPLPPATTFEVATIKPNQSGEEVGRMMVSGDRLRATNMSVRTLIGAAFGHNGRHLLKSQIAGGPEWMNADRFDIVAKADGNVRDLTSVAILLQKLLVERFQLKTHIEKREQPVFTLALARPDGRFGPGLQASTVNCQNARGPHAAAAATPAPCASKFGDGAIHARSYSMPNLVASLSSIVDSVVIDQTRLTGTFDVELQWKPEPLAGDAAAAALDDRPSIFTAVQEQLGLKLEPGRAPVDVVVVESVERPTQD